MNTQKKMKQSPETLYPEGSKDTSDNHKNKDFAYLSVHSEGYNKKTGLPNK